MIVYALHHRRPRSGWSKWPVADLKVLGYFRSIDAAEAAQQTAVQLEGFRDYPDSFSIVAYELDQSLFQDGIDVRADLALLRK